MEDEDRKQCGCREASLDAPNDLFSQSVGGLDQLRSRSDFGLLWLLTLSRNDFTVYSQSQGSNLALSVGSEVHMAVLSSDDNKPGWGHR